MAEKYKTSVIWTISKDDLQKIIDESSTKVEILKKLGFDGYNGNHRTLSTRIITDKLNMDKFNINYQNFNDNRTKIINFDNKPKMIDILTQNSTYNRQSLKKRLVSEKLKDYKCVNCGNIGEWNGKKLSLQLEHINGINNDNRLENLCFLCPNCHSQTETFSGKNAKTKYFCGICKVEIRGYSNFCHSCSQTRKFEVSKEELEKLIIEKPFTEIGKIFGVTDNTIRNRCKKFDISTKKYEKGYWVKKINIKDLKDKYNSGVSLEELSKLFNVRKDTIRRKLIDLGIINKKEILCVNIKDVLTLKNEGMTEKNISIKLKCHITTIYRILRNFKPGPIV